MVDTNGESNKAIGHDPFEDMEGLDEVFQDFSDSVSKDAGHSGKDKVEISAERDPEAESGNMQAGNEGIFTEAISKPSDDKSSMATETPSSKVVEHGAVDSLADHKSDLALDQGEAGTEIQVEPKPEVDLKPEAETKPNAGINVVVEAEVEPEAETETEDETEAVTNAVLEEAADVKVEPEVTEEKLGDVETVPEVESESMPSVEAEPEGEASQILDDLIAIIDTEVEEAFGPGAMAELVPEKLEGATGEEQHVIFEIAGTEYATHIDNVTEIGRPLAVTSIPNVPKWVLGVANLRGDIISMVDLRSFLGMEQMGYSQASRMLVAHANQGELTTGLVVDRVTGIRYLSIEQIGEPTAAIEDQIAPYLRGVYKHDGRLLVVLDLDKLLLSSEMRQFEPV